MLWASSTSGTQTIQGCLSGSNGNYTLTDKSGKIYHLAGDTSQLIKHVGHEVEVTGTMKPASSSSGTTGGQASTSGTSRAGTQNTST